MQEISEIQSLPLGAVFRRTDLHVHTPASRDMHSRWRAAKPADLIEQALKGDLQVIAVTDHNSVEWCDSIREAAAGTGLHVFPGVEISTSEGHILAIFDPKKPSSDIRQFLIQIGIRQHDFGNLEVIADRGLAAVAEKIEQEGGIAIAAHVDREKGFWKLTERTGTRRRQIHACPHIRAFEIVDPAMRDDFLAGQIHGYPRKVSCVQGSDCFPPKGDRHQLDAIGHRHCYLSMDEVSVSGLRQALLDPDVRIRFMTDPKLSPTAVIEGIWIPGGFLDGQKFRFNDKMTCLIGGTGSGKSLTLELIRFVLDQQVDASVLPHIAGEIDRMLRFALNELDTVYVLIRKGDDRYLIQRSWLPNDPPPPTVSRVIGEEIESIDDPIHVPTFFPIKGFSQSEIIEYAREPLARLSLVDDLIDTSQETESVARTKSELQQNAAELIALRAQLAKGEQTLRELPGLKEEISRLSGFLKHPRVRQQDAWYRERAVLDRADETLGAFEGSVSEDYPTIEAPLIQKGDLRPKTPSTALMQKILELDKEIRSAIEQARQGLSTSVETFRVRLGEIRSEWDKRFQRADREYRKLVSGLDTTSRGQAALHEKLQRLRKKEQRLEEMARRIKEATRPKLRQLEKRREELLTKLQTARNAITAKRRTKADELSTRLEKKVLLKIGAGKDDRRFRDRILDLRVGSRVQDGDIGVIAAKLHPVPLVKSLLAGDFQTPAQESGLAAELFERFYENVVQRERLADLYDLQLVDLDDVVEIQFAVEANSYRELEALAHGQKCTVVLMIALAEGDFPLLVDQPEDALHAPWIEDYIVSTLRHRRGTRQCVFATRSANVLVSADAEQVIALKADAQHGLIERTGAIDRFDTRDLILYHVEGGKEAFRRRQEKYGLNSVTL